MSELQKLKWPISTGLEGRKVLFQGFIGDEDHSHWGFKKGSEYVIGKGTTGALGPVSEKGEAPSVNWGFDFVLLPEEEVKPKKIFTSLEEEMCEVLSSLLALHDEDVFVRDPWDEVMKKARQIVFKVKGEING